MHYGLTLDDFFKTVKINISPEQKWNEENLTVLRDDLTKILDKWKVN